MTVVLSAAAAMALSAGPAAAHVQAAKGGPIGPDPTENPTPHNGIECAAEFNPNIASIEDFTCPAPDLRGPSH